MSLSPLPRFLTLHTSLAEIPGEALGTVTPPGHALSLAVAVRHLTLVVAQLALLALEARVALALPRHVVTMAGTQDRTQHCNSNEKHDEANATQNTKEDTQGLQVITGKISCDLVGTYGGVSRHLHSLN